MGYRSTVAFIISFKDKETLDNYLAPRLLDENLKQYIKYKFSNHHKKNKLNLFNFKDVIYIFIFINFL